MFSVSAPGKVILHGEHAVVYGKTALAASLDLRTTLTFRTNTPSKTIVDLHLPIIDLHHTYDIAQLTGALLKDPIPLANGTERSAFSFEKPGLIDFPRLLERARSFIRTLSDKKAITSNQESALLSFFVLFTGMFSSVTVPLEAFAIEITTDLTIESGMGSSASFGVSLTAALFHYIRQQAAVSVEGTHRNISKNNYKPFMFWCKSLDSFDHKEKELICQWAFLSDRIVHGNPSGIDNSVCTYGSIIQFKKGKDGADIQLIPDSKLLKVLLVHTGVQRDTGKMVAAVADKLERHTTVVEHILSAIDAVTVSGAGILRQLSGAQMSSEDIDVNISRLGELIDMNQSLLQALGVSHVTLEKICSIVRRRNLHGKLTGAGGGGYAYVLLPPKTQPSDVDALKSELVAEGFTCQQVGLGGPGVMLHNSS